MASHLSSHTSTNSPKKLSFTQHSISPSRSLSTDATQMTESDTYEPSALRALDNNVNMSCILCHRLYEPNSDPVVSDKDDPSILDLTTSAQNGCMGCFLLSQAARAFPQLWAHFKDDEVRVFICPTSRPVTWGSEGQFHLEISHHTQARLDLWETITIHVGPWTDFSIPCNQFTGVS